MSEDDLLVFLMKFSQSMTFISRRALQRVYNDLEDSLNDDSEYEEHNQSSVLGCSSAVRSQ